MEVWRSSSDIALTVLGIIRGADEGALCQELRETVSISSVIVQLRKMRPTDAKSEFSWTANQERLTAKCTFLLLQHAIHLGQGPMLQTCQNPPVTSRTDGDYQ